MRSAAQTYKNVARQTSSPRELEASLLLQAAARLQSVCDGWDRNRGQLDDALLYNRKLWSVFLSEMTDASDVNLSKVMNSLPVGGMMTRIVCGNTIKRKIWASVRPSVFPASVWPRSTEAMPARMISAM